MKWLCLTIGLYVTVSPAVGQSAKVIDSLEHSLPSLSEPDKARAIFTLVSYYRRSDPKKAMDMRPATHKLMTSRLGSVRAYGFLTEGMYLTGNGELDSALLRFDQARKEAQPLKDSLLMGHICSSMGRTLVSAGRAEEAVSSLMEGLRMVDRKPDRELAIKLRINLIWAYLELKRFEDGIKLGRESLPLLDSSHMWMGLYVFNNMAICYGAVGKVDSARIFVERGMTEAARNNDIESLANSHFILGTIYSNANRDDLAIAEYKKAAPYRQKIGNPFFIVSDLYTLASLYHKTGRYKDGIQSGLEALEVARKNNLLLKFENTYQVLALNYEGAGDFRQASRYYSLWASSKDSIYQRANAAAIADAETRYRTEKKEKEIMIQKATIDLQQANLKRTWLLMIAGAVVSILIAALFYINNRRRREVLKREYELSVQEAYISASIASQESERKRFAQDLHDGMGQLISALRLMLGQTHAAPDKQEEQMKKAENILHEMHREIRSIAFNLMPQLLIRSGLIPALQEMATRLNESGSIRISVQSYETPNRFTEIVEISLYRIIQEWVNNVIKYAHASQITIQIVGHHDDLTLTIEDNGKGFDQRVLETSAGNGWKNIQSRIKLIRATAEVDTMPGRDGTTFIVVIPRS